MKTDLSAEDLRKLAELEVIRRRNFAIFNAYSTFLNESSDFVTKEMVDDLVRSCGLSEDETFLLLFANACGADPSSGDETADAYIRDYIRPSIHLLSTQNYVTDAYFANIHIDARTLDNWSFGYECYKPYEAFICGDITPKEGFMEIPHVGYFKSEFHYPVVYENGREWMAVKPSEIETMRVPIELAKGNVVTFGLGMGYYSYMVSLKDEVKSVTIVERDERVIHLFKEFILPQFPHPEKIIIECSDAFAFVRKQMQSFHFDFAFVDLWHDASDGVELYKKMRKLESLSPATQWTYWVEDTLLSHIRWSLWDDLRRAIASNSLSQYGVSSYGDVVRLLSKEGLRQWLVR